MDESDDVGIDVPFISWLNRREILNTTTCDEDCVNEHMILEVIPTSLKNIHGGQLTSVCTILGDSRTGKCVVVDPGTDEPDMIIDIIHSRGLTSIEYILISHAHITSYFAAFALQKVFQTAQIALHKDDLFLWRSAEVQSNLFGVVLPGAPKIMPPRFSVDETNFMMPGSRGIAVQKLQQCLITLGHMDKSAIQAQSGVFRQRTAEALNRFRRSVGLMDVVDDEGAQSDREKLEALRNSMYGHAEYEAMVEELTLYFTNLFDNEEAERIMQQAGFDDEAEARGKEAVVGDEVKGNFLNRGIWLPATITRVRRNNTVDLQFHHGEEEPGVIRSRIAGAAWWKTDGTDYEWWSDPDIILEHGELLEVEGCKDLNVMVLHSPGHTPGSVCYHFINEELLCTGHTLLKGGTGPLTIGANVTSLLKEGIPRIMKLSRANAALDDEEKMIKVSPSMGPTTYLNNEIEDNPIFKAKQREPQRRPPPVKPEVSTLKVPKRIGWGPGTRGQNVSMLQWILIYLGYMLEEDVAFAVGFFGPKTRLGLQKFQAEMEIVPNEPATYDKKTREILKKTVDEYLSSSPNKKNNRSKL